MFRKCILVLAAAGLVVVSGGALRQDYKRTITVKSSEVTAYTPSDTALGKYYVVHFEVPPLRAGEEVERAALDFYVNAASLCRVMNIFPDTDTAQTLTFENHAPVIEVYALNHAMGAELDASRIDFESRRVQPVAVGDRRHVQMDVTSIVRSFVADPSRNRGLVIGSVSGMREGDFTLRSDVLPDGAVAEVRLYFGPRR